jgi:hypothetical protein
MRKFDTISLEKVLFSSVNASQRCGRKDDSTVDISKLDIGLNCLTGL